MTSNGYLTRADRRALVDGGAACVWATRDGITVRGWLTRDGLVLDEGPVDASLYEVTSR